MKLDFSSTTDSKGAMMSMGKGYTIPGDRQRTIRRQPEKISPVRSTAVAHAINELLQIVVFTGS